MSNETIRCPKCNSSELHVDKQGFKTGRALAGGLITGNILASLAAGGIGMNKIQITCLKCGYKFNAGEAYSTTSIANDRNLAEFEKHVIKEKEETAMYLCNCGKESCLPISHPVCPKCGRRLSQSQQFVPQLQERKGCLCITYAILGMVIASIIAYTTC